jgi:hypothetical protein
MLKGDFEVFGSASRKHHGFAEGTRAARICDQVSSRWELMCEFAEKVRLFLSQVNRVRRQ